MNENIPKWGDWLEMSDQERIDCQNNWNIYEGEGQYLVERIVSKFKEKYGNIPHLEIIGKGICHGGTWVIIVGYPFIFDKRKIPESFLGISIRGGTSDEDLPDEFRKRGKKKYIWSPERYEKFVDKNVGRIRSELGEPKMDRQEMLSALCGQDFNEYVKKYKEWENKGAYSFLQRVSNHLKE